MSETINVLLDQLTKAAPPAKLNTRKVEIEGDKGKTDVIQFRKGNKGDWLPATSIESLTINNDVAGASRLADSGFTYRWIKDKLTDEQVELIGAIRFKNACIRIILKSMDMKKRLENMSKNYTLNFDADTMSALETAVSNNTLSGLTAFNSRDAGMKRSAKKGEAKPLPHVTL